MTTQSYIYLMTISALTSICMRKKMYFSKLLIYLERYNYNISPLEFTFLSASNKGFWVGNKDRTSEGN